MRLHRFYVTQPLGEEIVVDDVSTIKQWSRVFRYKQGDSVILFDGHHKDCTYEIASIDQKEAKLFLTSVKETYPPKKSLTLYLSVIKKDNFELVVQKCTELGITRIVPVLGEHSEKKSLNLDRLQLIAQEAAEQCGRGDVPTIEEIVNISVAFKQREESVPQLVANMGGLQNGSDSALSLLQSPRLAIWIGPEGGWSPKDLEIFALGESTTVSLGSNVLRAETAGIVFSALYLLQ